MVEISLACPTGTSFVMNTSGAVMNHHRVWETMGDGFDNDFDGKTDSQDQVASEWCVSQCITKCAAGVGYADCTSNCQADPQKLCSAKLCDWNPPAVTSGAAWYIDHCGFWDWDI
jgi:hypothetical protein